MKRNPNYNEIANDYLLWEEYADPEGLDRQDWFDDEPVSNKIRFLVACFGPEMEVA